MKLAFYPIFGIFLALATQVTLAESAQDIPTATAEAVFLEAHNLCTADAARTWGVSLCVPMMLVDPDNRHAVLNQHVNGSTGDRGIYRLTLPANIGVANTSVDYQGKRWSMVIWPLPKDAKLLAILLMHESYHSIQPTLGLQGSGGLGTNAELDSKDGRIWMRAELAALRSALSASGEKRRKAISDALLFRSYRMSLWSNARREEQDLELNEGLAESTGIDIALPTNTTRIAAAIHDIDTVNAEKSFVRSFAYATGPGYVELIEAVDPEWRKHVTPTLSLSQLTAKVYKIAPPKPDRHRALGAINAYCGKQIIAQEKSLYATTLARNKKFSEELIDGPKLTLSLTKFAITFDPRQVFTLPKYGSIYRQLTLEDAWGRLTISEEGMALISSSFDKVTVPAQCAPQGLQLKCKGVSLTLNNTYSFRPDPNHNGSFVVIALSH